MHGCVFISCSFRFPYGAGSLQHQSESNGPRLRKDKPKEESVNRPEGGNLREPSFEELEEELEELQQLTVRLDYDSKFA